MSRHDEIKAIIHKWDRGYNLDSAVYDIEKLFPAPGWRELLLRINYKK
jgi:hypothetical protein